MELLITRDNFSEALSAYHGCHDADVVSISVRPETGSFALQSVDFRLRAKNHVTGSIDFLDFELKGVEEYRLTYSTRFDYPCIRDEIGIGFFDDLYFVDFGMACEVRDTPEAYRVLENYFACRSIIITISVSAG